jgi:hypothetical protein
MAEILVLDVCARRLSAAGDCLCGVSIYDQAMRRHAPEFPTVSIARRIVFLLFFSLFAIVPAPAAFLSPAQGLAL